MKLWRTLAWLNLVAGLLRLGFIAGVWVVQVAVPEAKAKLPVVSWRSWGIWMAGASIAWGVWELRTRAPRPVAQAGSKPSE